MVPWQLPLPFPDLFSRALECRHESYISGNADAESSSCDEHRQCNKLRCSLLPCSARQLYRLRSRCWLVPWLEGSEEELRIERLRLQGVSCRISRGRGVSDRSDYALRARRRELHQSPLDPAGRSHIWENSWRNVEGFAGHAAATTSAARWGDSEPGTSLLFAAALRAWEWMAIPSAAPRRCRRGRRSQLFQGRRWSQERS